MEELKDVFPVTVKAKSGANEFIEFKVRHARDELGGFCGVFFDLIKRGFGFDAGVKGFAEADFVADFGPIVCRVCVKCGEATFAGSFEVVIPNRGDG